MVSVPKELLAHSPSRDSRHPLEDGARSLPPWTAAAEPGYRCVGIVWTPLLCDLGSSRSWAFMEMLYKLCCVAVQ